MTAKPHLTAVLLLAWYDTHARALPWRAPPGAPAPEPYRVWLSEIMLQQTTVAAVMPYFEAFIARWPTVAALADAPVEAVLAAWAGLGYYSRARNLHACARIVAGQLGGRFPDTVAGLKALPGIGDYTAAAIAAIAFGRPAVVVDGNVERVVARLFRLETAGPALKAQVGKVLVALVPADRPGDFAQAMMDLGATLCTPRSPQCPICPLRGGCAAAAEGDAARFPRKTPKAVRPQRYGLAFWHEVDGQVLLERRPARGLLAGMLGLPGTPWSETVPPASDLPLLGEVEHVFTHFTLKLSVVAGPPPPGTAQHWHRADQIASAGLPSLFLKAARLAQRQV